MKYLRYFLASRRAKRIHRVAAGVALLVLWALVGPAHQVMHAGAFLTAELWIGFADLAACLLVGAWVVPPRRLPAPPVQTPAAPAGEMKKAA